MQQYNITNLSDDTKMMTNLSWMAGFFDGEGNIHLRYSHPTYANRRGQYTVWVHVTQTNEHVLNSFNEFGGHIYRRHGTNPNHADSYTWRLCGLKAKPFLECILPYLRLKKEIAVIALKFIDTFADVKRSRGLSEEIVQRRASLLKDYRTLQPQRAMGRIGMGRKRSGKRVLIKEIG